MANRERSTKDAFAAIERELWCHYTSESDSYPWVVTYSGGKDSTTVLHLVITMLLKIGSGNWHRKVHVVSNDTMVESPLVIAHLYKNIREIGEFAEKHKLPVSTKITKPYINDTFWFNLIGKGYPSPNSMFRWCTSRLKIEPTTRFIKEQVDRNGYVYMLLGVRKSESATRAKSVKKHSVNGSYFNKHSDLPNCKVATPIADLIDDEIWFFLLQNRPPWGKTYRDLITLYKNAKGGECPTVLSKGDAPSCGSTSARFGCWTCTVVEKDSSLDGLIDSGFEEFEGLSDFRNWLLEIRNNKRRRLKYSRQGKYRYKNGKLIPGSFTISTRKKILNRLLRLQEETGMQLVDKKEIHHIKKQWHEDAHFIRIMGGR